MQSIPQTVFTARNLTKTYHMGEVEVPALRSLDLEIYQGEYETGKVVLEVIARINQELGTTAVEQQIAELPGVAALESSIVQDVTLDLANVGEPVIGHMIGLSSNQASLNRLTLRRVAASRNRTPSATGRWWVLWRCLNNCREREHVGDTWAGEAGQNRCSAKNAIRFAFNASIISL